MAFFDHFERKTMKSLLYVVSFVLVAAFASGCSSVVAAKHEDNVNYTVQFTGQDFEIGDVIVTELPYNEKVPGLKALLLNKAIADNNCDTILLPRYEVIKKSFGKNVIRLTGRAATFKVKEKPLHPKPDKKS